ncbi:MAG: hypothetical protein NC410_01365 [Oscillibacter sp.]|nr:hypothetical protein [Oscillibacter sp.]
MDQFNEEDYLLIPDVLAKELPHLRVCFISLRHVFAFLSQYRRYKDDAQRIYGYALPNIITTVGFYRVIGEFLKKMSPRCVLLSNDHVNCSRIVVQHCNSLGIPTLYIQHASVANYYPKLDFTYSFLDGEESYNKYTEIHKDGTSKAVILGACRFDYMKGKYIQHKKNSLTTVGLAVNKIDDYEIIKNVCHTLLDVVPKLRIVIRTHPSMLTFKRFDFGHTQIEYTSANDVPPIDFLNRIDLLIANDSSIHLDALMARVPSVMYSMSSSGFSDQYSYVAQGLVHHIKNEIELRDILKSQRYKSVSLEKARYFNAAYDREYEGKCSVIVADFIKQSFDSNFLASLGLPVKSINQGPAAV